MKIVPLFDRILVKRDDAAEKTPGGLILPDNAKEKPRRGKVVAVGEGKMKEDGTRHPMCLKDGDCVLFSSYAGSEIELDDCKLLVLSQEEVLAKIA